MLNQKFIDNMDDSRVVQPTSVRGKTATCRVFWRDDDGCLSFGGLAEVPAALFSAPDSAVGFRPLSAANLVE